MKKIFFGLIFALLAFQVNAATINLNSGNAGSLNNFAEQQPFGETHQLNLDASIATWNLDFSIQDISLNSTGGFGLQIFNSAGSLVATVTPPSSILTLAAGDYTMKFIGSGGTAANGLVIGTAAAVSGVPVPAAVWLFGSALMGLVGASRRKSAPQAVVA